MIIFWESNKMKLIKLFAIFVVLLSANISASNIKESTIDGVKLGMSKEEAIKALESKYKGVEDYVFVDKGWQFGYFSKQQKQPVIILYTGDFSDEYKTKNVVIINRRYINTDYKKNSSKIDKDKHREFFERTIEQIKLEHGAPVDFFIMDSVVVGRWCNLTKDVTNCSRAPYFMTAEGRLNLNYLELNLTDRTPFNK